MLGACSLYWRVDPRARSAACLNTTMGVFVMHGSKRTDFATLSPWYLMFSLFTLRVALTKTGLINRQAIARILSTLLCCLVVATRQFSVIGGPYAFLVITIKELIFAIQENLAQQLEGTVLNVMGALFAIGFSTAAKCLANLPETNGVVARAIPAVFLVFITFVGERTVSLDAHQTLTLDQLGGSKAVYPGYNRPCEFAALCQYGYSP